MSRRGPLTLGRGPAELTASDLQDAARALFLTVTPAALVDESGELLYLARVAAAVPCVAPLAGACGEIYQPCDGCRARALLARLGA